LTLAAIVQRLKLNPSAIPNRAGTRKEIADKKNTMGATVSRYPKEGNSNYPRMPAMASFHARIDNLHDVNLIDVVLKP